MSYGYILLTIVLTVYGQLVIKWQVSKAGVLPTGVVAQSGFLLRMLVNPWILSALIAALIAALSWMAALTKFDLSFAYPFMSLSFVFVLALSALFFREPFTTYKIVGLALIALGLFVSSRSA
jgi:multidrug transporter EmrE-like cation transporter